MGKGVSLQQVSSVLGKAISNKSISPAQLVTKEAIGVGKTASNELFGYDFVTLGIKLLVFFTIAFIFSKLMEAILFARGIFTTVANLLGFQIPQADEVPESLKKLFDGGIYGFKFWDIIKIVAVLLVIAEAVKYVNSNRKIGSNTSPMTMGIFILLIGVLAVTTIPELYQRIKSTDLNLESLR